jgi:hypothetical protein
MAAAAVSGDDLMATVTALSRKSQLLSKSGHFARSAEKYAAAVAAAQLLQQPDSLIVAFLQMEEAGKLSMHVSTCASLAEAAPQLERVYRVLMPSIVATVQRRKAAGTLVPGACLASEAAFYGEMQQYCAALSGCRPFEPAALAALGSLVGYEEYVSAADIVLSSLALQVSSATPILADGPFAAQHAFVLSALELVRQPRVLNTESIGGEASLVHKCRLVFSSSATMDALPAGWAQQLRDALQRVESSGLMQLRKTDEELAEFLRIRSAERAAAAADADARGLRVCALSSCGAREAHVSHWKLCSACKMVVYCSKAHQAEDWPAHKRACKAARKEAAAAAAGAGGASGA